jgi:4-amino-4-deoxy-L-arabinose transferase-like glycosyltransferase
MLLPGLRDSPIGGTEGHRVITASQMLQSPTPGGWIVPMLFDQPYGRKPPMHYWILAGSIALLGQNELAYRLPSVLAFAATCAMVAWSSRRWFGVRAAWTGAAAALGLAALWAQSRSADIDAMHTFAAVATTLLILQLHHSPAGRRWVLLIATLMCSVSMLLKLPGNVPIIVGAVLAGAIQVDESRIRIRLRSLVNGHLWIPLLGGGFIFAIWVLSGVMWSTISDLRIDLSGANEGAGNLARWINEPSRWLNMLAMPLLLLMYGLPASLGALTPMRRDLMPLASIVERAMIWRISTCVIVAVALFVLAGQANPRYGYLILPVAAVGFAASVELWCRQSARPLAKILTCSVACILVGSIVFTQLIAPARASRSGYKAATLLNRYVGVNAPVTAGWMIFAHPEILWYAKCNVTSPGQRRIQPNDLEPRDQLVLLHAVEFPKLKAHFQDQLQIITIVPTPSGGAYLVQLIPPLEKTGEPTSRQSSGSTQTPGR